MIVTLPVPYSKASLILSRVVCGQYVLLCHFSRTATGQTCGILPVWKEPLTSWPDVKLPPQTNNVESLTDGQALLLNLGISLFHLIHAA